MNLPIANSAIAFSSHMMLETMADGQVAAWVAEVPDCRVVADSREGAIVALENAYTHRMQGIEIIALPTVKSTSSPENPWASSYGVLKDDDEFHAWHEQFWAEKQRSHDDDPILSIEECLQVM